MKTAGTDTLPGALVITDGMQGLITASTGYGRGLVSDGSIRLDYHKKKISFSGTYSFLRTHQYRRVTYFKSIINEDDIFKSNLINEGFPVQRNYYAGLSINYQANNKTSFSGTVNAYDKKGSINTTNNFKITGPKSKDTAIKIEDIEVNDWTHFMTNLGMLHSISNKQNLLLNAGFLYYFNSNPVNLNSDYFNEKNELIYSLKFKSRKQTPIRFWIISGNYSAEVNRKISIELGIRSTISKFRNNLTAENRGNGNWQKDMGLSSFHNRTETIHAVNALFVYRPDTSIAINASLRYEHTMTNMSENKSKVLVDYNYGKLFPSLSFRRAVGKDKRIFLSYSSGITRPKFNDISRSIVFFAPKSILSGNPNLEPAFYHYMKAGYETKKYTLSLSYDHESHSIAWFKNLKQFRSAGLSLNIPAKINSWWTTQHSVTARSREVIGICDDILFKARKINIEINAVHRFSFSHNWNVELSGFYQSATLSGLYKLHSLGSLNVDIRKKLGRGSLAFSANDIFTTNKLRLSAFHPVIDEVQNYCFQLTPGTFRVSYAISFGNNKLQRINDSKTGLEEELARIK